MAGGAYDTVVKSGRAHMAQTHQNRRNGPSRKNLQSTRVSRPNPSSNIRSMAGRAIKGPDKGAGGM